MAYQICIKCIQIYLLLPIFVRMYACFRSFYWAIFIALYFHNLLPQTYGFKGSILPITQLKTVAIRVSKKSITAHGHMNWSVLGNIVRIFKKLKIEIWILFVHCWYVTIISESAAAVNKMLCRPCMQIDKTKRKREIGVTCRMPSKWICFYEWAHAYTSSIDDNE